MNKKLIIIVSIFLSLFYKGNADRLDNNLKNDELFKYVMNICPYNKNIDVVIHTYIEFGLLENVFPLIEKSEDKYNLLRYAFIKNSFNDEKRLKKVKTLISNFKNEYYKNYLLLDLALAYAKIGKFSEAKKIFSDIYKKFNHESDLYERVLKLVEPFGLTDYLIKAGFLNEAEKILIEA